MMKAGHVFRILRNTFLAACALVSAGFAQTTPMSLDWPVYGQDPGNMRYVNLDQINIANVATLAPVWMFHTGVMNDRTSFESQPIVINGIMYVTSPHDHVFALDAATGAVKWTYQPDLPVLTDLAICCGQTNRGVAVGKGKVFLGQLDATLVALDANTGAVVWKVAVDPYQEAWTETMAPLFVDGKVIIGASGGEFMRRGHVTAYDADTGNMLWRFFTAPGPGEIGNDTWAGESWKTGGATVWTTPAADLQLGLLYLSTANAAPDENGADRAGDNLFTASVVAIELATGKYRWHFQEVHHDIWDYDSAQPPHLFTLERNGQQIPALGHANKNGNYFILDRRTGKPLFDVMEIPVPTEPAWQHPSPTQPKSSIEPLIPQAVDVTPSGLKSAPMWTPPQEQAFLIQPGFESGPEWTPGAYSPRTKFAYLPVGGYDPWVFHAIPPMVNSLGSTATRSIEGIDRYGLFDAVDTTTGKIAWKIRLNEGLRSGVVVAGDLVFFGEGNGKFNAVDAKTGKILWTFKSNEKGAGGANGAPAAYVVNGREFVVMAFGGNSGVRSNQTSPPGDTLIAFALPPLAAGEPRVITGNPKQVNTGDIPDSAMTPAVDKAPPDARVIEIAAHDGTFHPDNFTVLAGEKIALHIVNVDPAGAAGFALKLSGGPRALKGSIGPGKDGFFVFTAPAESGIVEFFSPLGTQRLMGMTGFMRVAPPCAAASAFCVSAAGVVSATNFKPGAIAPGEVVTLFGAGLGPDRGVVFFDVNNITRVPDTLGGTRVLFDGVPAPILFASASQINLVAPFGLAGKSTTQLQVERNNSRTPAATVSVLDTAPSIFTMTGAGSGQGAILNQDGSLNSASSPAVKGTVVAVFGTGEGTTDPPVNDGAFITSPQPKPVLPVLALIDGKSAEVVSAHEEILAGVLRVDVRVPTSASSGSAVPIQIVVGRTIGPRGATIAIQ